jgi:hypothetical protein
VQRNETTQEREATMTVLEEPTAFDIKIQRKQAVNRLMTDLYLSGRSFRRTDHGRIDRKDVEEGKELEDVPVEGWIP